MQSSPRVTVGKTTKNTNISPEAPFIVGNTKEKGRKTVANASKRGRKNKQHQEYT